MKKQFKNFQQFDSNNKKIAFTESTMTKKEIQNFLEKTTASELMDLHASHKTVAKKNIGNSVLAVTAATAATAAIATTTAIAGFVPIAAGTFVAGLIYANNKIKK
jgi:hypothetical protein